ncbi:hypothetical protein JB92DRAFT_2900034, partial [Gautieria morchelliformis]
MVSLFSILFTIALSLALPAWTVPVPQVSSSSVAAAATSSATGIPVPNGNQPITFGELTTPSRGGTFDDFLESPGPAAPKPIVKVQLLSSAQARPTKPAVLPSF